MENETLNQPSSTQSEAPKARIIEDDPILDAKIRGLNVGTVPDHADQAIVPREDPPLPTAEAPSKESKKSFLRDLLVPGHLKKAAAALAILGIAGVAKVFLAGGAAAPVALAPVIQPPAVAVQVPVATPAPVAPVAPAGPGITSAPSAAPATPAPGELARVGGLDIPVATDPTEATQRADDIRRLTEVWPAAKATCDQLPSDYAKKSCAGAGQERYFACAKNGISWDPTLPGCEIGAVSLETAKSWRDQTGSLVKTVIPADFKKKFLQELGIL